ncbi:RNA polymerase sigma factor [Streptomyces ginkgonis]|uniref:RNA polymerase sigma factor n=1 Tax=Streptomyces ginkgonis TaxID=1812259 RepID=UPI002176EF14|nr:sigma-70 family RNA polymerase sigma factor [Streptomyces ginkgonis]
MSEPEHGTDFEAFVLKTSALYYRIARAEARDLHSAEDAVQVVYMRMFARWTELSSRHGKLESYGRTAVKNAVKDQFRRNQNLVFTSPQEIPESESRSNIPDAAYEMIREGIDELVAELPEKQRQVVTLCIFQDMSPAEAGKRLRLKEASVKRYIHAAITNLKKSINGIGEEVTA